MYTTNNYYLYFLAANRITDYRFCMESEGMLPVYQNSLQLSSPGYVQDGKVYFALRDIIEGFGGTVGYSGEYYIVTLDGREVKLSTTGSDVWSDGGLREYSIADKSSKNYCKAGYTADVFETLWGIQIKLDGDRYVCEKAG